MYRHFDVKKLRNRCRQNISEIFDDVRALGGEVVGEPGNQYAYKNNGASVLAVAHCDFVASVKRQFGVLRMGGSTTIFSPQLDDRLGVYAILDVLPLLNIPVDILLTEGEETGRSTAQHFKTEKKYKWMVEFDRRGDDAVVYGYGSKEWEEILRTDFPRVGHGSFSDICKLTHLGCRGVNVGIGYQGEHSNTCSMNLKMFLSQMVCFRNFWQKHHKTRFDFTEPVRREYGSAYGSGYGSAYGGYVSGYDPDIYDPDIGWYKRSSDPRIHGGSQNEKKTVPLPTRGKKDDAVKPKPLHCYCTCCKSTFYDPNNVQVDRNTKGYIRCPVCATLLIPPEETRGGVGNSVDLAVPAVPAVPAD
jgi:hypothetical protein